MNLNIVPAQREFAAAHAARRARMAAAATDSETRRIKAENAAREAMRAAARRAIEYKRMERDKLLIAIERAMEAHQTTAIVDAPASSRHQPPTKEVIRLIAQANGVTWGDVCSARRMKFLVKPRQLAIFIVWALTNRSLPQLGVMFGGRDHTTILHAVRKMSGEFGFNYPADRLRAYDKAKEILIAAGYVWPGGQQGE